MEKTDLSSAAYWETPGIDLRLNPRLELPSEGLAEFVRSELGLESAVVFSTSGSSGSGPKYVVLTRDAILASAAAVNRHLSVTPEDRWLCALTTFHVGGVGVWARAHGSGSFATGIGEKEHWDKTGAAFVEACREHRITLTALTPTHLHDVILREHRCPESVRGVLIGGAPLDDHLLRAAVQLGWPILRTYGMTEAASQIATEDPRQAREIERPDFMDLLPVWDAAIRRDGELTIRGAPLFHAYLVRGRRRNRWQAEFPFDDDGRFRTGDRAEVESEKLRWMGRVDDWIKKLGERISLDHLRSQLRAGLSEIPATILARPHDRLGNELVAVFESDDAEAVAAGLAAFQTAVAPFERIDRAFLVDQIPRTGIGKVAHGQLSENLSRGMMREIPA